MTSTPCRIIFADDEADLRRAVAQWLGLAGLDVTVYDGARAALEHLLREGDAILVSDVKMPEMDGLELLRAVVARDPDLPVVLLTGHGDVAMAVEAMREGAYDFIEKPFAPERLVETIRRACEKRRLVLENRGLRAAIAARSGIEGRILGTSPAIEALRRTILDLAGTRVNVIIRGETGTGKELVARCLHDFGPRRARPFVAVNCGAVPETMFESEFFGHEAGAFTGAVGRRAGKFEHADGGTLFMDEIESMPLASQVKVLRALQEKTIERLGSHKSVAIDIRTIAAAKADLLAAVRKGRFREDLYYRLAVAELSIPPLRERREDVPLLFAFFAAEAAALHGRAARPLGAAELRRLAAHDWPGNVRELKNAAERYAIGIATPIVPGGEPPPEAAAPPSLAAAVEAFERRRIEAALAQCQGDIGAVMALLDLPRRTLNDKMARYGIDRQRFLPR
jgi:two-component system C4-dicarboxylate transport response regulator DctD